MDAATPPPSLRAYVDALGEGLYGVDLAGACTFINAAALRILRYEAADDLLGRNMHEAIHHTRADGRVFPQSECPLLHTARSGRAVRLENELLWRRDGTSLFAEYSSFPVLHEGAPAGSVITFNENKVRHDSRVRLAVQHALSQVLAGARDSAGPVVPALRTVASGFGWEVGFFWRSTTAWSGVLHAADHWQNTDAAASFVADTVRAGQAQAGGLVRRAWSTRQPVLEATGSAEGTDARLRAAAEHGFRSSFAFPVAVGAVLFGVIEFFDRDPIRIDDGLIESISVMGQMIGRALERQANARDLRRSEARFRTIANGIPQLAWMTGPDGSLTWLNDRWFAFSGVTRDAILLGGWPAVVHPDHLGRVEAGMAVAVAARGDWEDAFPMRAADGAWRWFLSRALPIRADDDDSTPDGPVLGWFGTATDITEIREAEQGLTEALGEARAANAAKSEFLANMSHELRTPLSAIIGYAEMLGEEVADGAEADEVLRDVGKIETNARHLLGLINDVLDLSKVESGKMEAFAETFEVAAMLRDLGLTVSSLVAKNGNRLELALPHDLGRMHSDITRIRQVILNLLSNAAKFTTGGVLTLAASRGPGPDGTDWIRFDVTDTGLGLSEEQRAQLFQRFHQADASTTRRFGGTGLGLALTRAFATLLGGDVDVRSTEGEGSTFTLHVPATLPEPAPDLTPEPEAAPHERQTVLVIDDDPAQQELMARFLDRAGYTCRSAIDGASGLRLARQLAPFAILLDITMPGMDGWSVLTALKADAALAAIPVVMVTFLDQRALATALGAADYMTKPVEWNRLGLVLDRFRQAEGRVLLVQTEDDARRRLSAGLREAGWRVEEAAGGADALASLADGVPQLILLDLTMPYDEGFAFLRELRARPDGAAVPVVVLTEGDLTPADRRQLRGATQVLHKGSGDLSELIERLRGIDVTAG